jgi:hypothetical protein
LDFKGTIIDYLCWLSTKQILIEWNKRIDDGLESLIQVWLFNRTIFNNLIRLFDKNPNYVFQDEIFKDFEEELYYPSLDEAFEKKMHRFKIINTRINFGQFVLAVKFIELYPEIFEGTEQNVADFAGLAWVNFDEFMEKTGIRIAEDFDEEDDENG